MRLIKQIRNTTLRTIEIQLITSERKYEINKNTNNNNTDKIYNAPDNDILLFLLFYL